jgi:hypothetical protein
MITQDDYERRIGKLEDDLKEREARIAELTKERDEALVLVSEKRETIQACSEQIERWKEAFAMEQDERGIWIWGDNEPLIQRYEELHTQYMKLLADWNKFVGEYNAIVAPTRRNFGRPLAASPAQQADVLKRRNAGQSLRFIEDATGLSFQTVRTIIDKADGVDRATMARLAKIAPNKMEEARNRARRRTRDSLPRSVTALGKKCRMLDKAAKGI